ncbi:MAG: CARDB domain-containing protein [Candidatus Sumerlaeaceae bacterium]
MPGKWDDVSGYGLVNGQAALAALGKQIANQGDRPACDDGGGGGGGGGGTPQNLDLIPAPPVGGSDSLVIATTTGTLVDAASYSAGDTIYVSYGVKNNGPASTAITFVVKLTVDGQLRDTFTVVGLAAGATKDRRNVNIGHLTPGNHTFTITVDANNNIAELNELNNVVSQTINVVAIQGDTIDDATDIVGLGGNCGGKCLGHLLSSNVGATTDSADLGTTAGATIWFKYEAEPKTFDYQVTFDTAGSDFDTMLAAFQEIVPGNPPLKFLVANNDNILGGQPTFTQSQVTVFIPANQTRVFYISVGGANNAQGNVRLNWACDGVRSRDHFASRLQLTTSTLISGNDSNKSATEEPSEPNPLNIADYLKSNWYGFSVTSDTLPFNENTRPIKITITELPDRHFSDFETGIQPDKPRFNPVIQVYTGNGIQTLDLYAAGATNTFDDSPYFFNVAEFNVTGEPGTPGVDTNARQATVVFIGAIGQDFKIQIIGFPTGCESDETASAGTYRLELEQLQNVVGAPNLTFQNTFSASNSADGLSGDSTIVEGQDVYLDFAVKNDGDAPAGAFVVVQVDGGERASKFYSLDPGEINTEIDFVIGALTSGNHIVSLTVDFNNDVPESNEGDNTITRVINVAPAP